MTLSSVPLNAYELYHWLIVGILCLCIVNEYWWRNYQGFFTILLSLLFGYTPDNRYKSNGWLKKVNGKLFVSCALCFEGESGSGKSSAMRKLVVDWARGPESENSAQSREETKMLGDLFDFVFLIQLKNIDGNDPLEKIIIQQHGLEEANALQKKSGTSWTKQRRNLYWSLMGMMSTEKRPILLLMRR